MLVVAAAFVQGTEELPCTLVNNKDVLEKVLF